MIPVVRQYVNARLAWSSALLAGLVFALLLAVSPSLHNQLHADVGDDHECLATILHTGKGAGPEAPPVLILADLGPQLFETSPPDHSRVVVAHILGARIFEHAPPFYS